ncbi:MAG: DUF5320 domain-containing protein [Methanospirillaceae archaeon]|nr:DUF5320 domain-containing protein [Methanospirillaceae archaeon]
MPGYNGTGPLGRGPMTGRGLGYCQTGYFRGGQRAPVTGNETIGTADEPAQMREQPVMPQYPGNFSPVYGLGRGGMPRGCGRGFGRGNRRGRCFW